MFEIFKDKNGEKFYFRLKAKNGEIILSSQGYASKATCKNGIDSVKTNAADAANFEKVDSDSGKFFFRLLAKNKQVIGTSQMYGTKAGRDGGVESVMKNAPGAEVKDTTVEA